MSKTPAAIMEELLAQYSVPEEKQMLLFTFVRLAHGFSSYPIRLKCVQARLQALSVLIYSNQLTDSVQGLLYSGLLEELVDVLEMKGDHLMEIKAAVLKALTSIIHLDRNPKLNTIIDATGAANFHGFLPVMVRNCIISLTSSGNNGQSGSSAPVVAPASAVAVFPQPLATALFSFLYHLASYESGGEALVSCGMLESLLKVIQWPSSELEHITFVTRAVRVIDLITNLDMASFQTHAGLTTFINRLELEVDHCRKHQPFQIQVGTKEERLTKVIEEAETIHDVAAIAAQEELAAAQDAAAASAASSTGDESMDVDPIAGPSGSGSSSSLASHLIQQDVPKPGLTCLPQRAALLKSMLNFLKKAIQEWDPAFSDSIRHVMEGSLPNSLKHIISNAEYYGPSLFLLATDVVTAYVFQEPSFLSSLQDKGLTDVVLHALLVKEVPATREVLASLPNVFSALCLNTRGLEAFVACKPFERLFKVLLSPDYLPAMRRRRSADPLGDTASNLGNAMDELMRHQPSLKQAATAAIIKLLEQVCSLGRDPKYVCWKSSGTSKGNSSSEGGNAANDAANEGAGGVNNGNNGGGNAGNGGGAEASSDEDEEEIEVDEAPPPVVVARGEEPRLEGDPASGEAQNASGDGSTKEPVPLVDYVLNVMKFVDAILSNNSTDDHCREFVSQKGLVPLMGVLGLPNLPVDFPIQPACQSVAAVCKSILNLAHEPQVLKQGLLHLKEVLNQLEPLHQPVQAPGSSVLLHELVSNQNPSDAINNPAATPLLHHMSAAHAYITMFVHVCRTGQADIRTISVSHWGSELGLQVLESLSRLYTSLVWESTVLLALCSEDTTLVDTQFGKADMEKLLPNSGCVTAGDSGSQQGPSSPASGASVDSGAGVTSAMEQLTTDSSDSNMMDTTGPPAASTSAEAAAGTEAGKDKKTNPQLQAQIKQIKPLLSGSSRLGRALAELFGLLVKLCVGSPLRQRRGQPTAPMPVMPSPPARAVASALTKLLTSGLSWQPPSTSPLPKFRLTFFICSVGFTSPMLFDEKKFPYHLMLYQFVSGGGQKSFFDAFYWAITMGDSVAATEGLENPGLPERTGEFLDAWLMLLEKMVNPKNVLESPHLLPDKALPNFKPFDTLTYLIKTHKTAFEAVMHIWGKKPLAVYGWRMSESVLSILCHILKGENLIKERLEKEKPPEAAKNEAAGASNNAAAAGNAAGASGQAASGASAVFAAAGTAPPNDADPIWANAANSSTPAEPDINAEHLQTLMDMGFPRERCIEAIQSVGGGLDAATDYLLNNPVPPLLQSSLGGPQYDLMRAIEMSLGETDEESGSAGTSPPGPNMPIIVPEPEPEEKLSPLEQERMKEQVIDTFTETALQGCLTLLDTLPDTVYRVTDLLIAVFQRNGEDFKKKLVSELMVEVKSSVRSLLEVVQNSDGKVTDDLLTTGPSAKAAARTHLFSLLFEDCSKLCVQLVEESDTMKEIVELIEQTQTLLLTKANKEPETKIDGNYTPKWITPILLFIDLYEKIVLSMKRRAAMKPLVSNTWKWFDLSSGKWCPYQNPQNKVIDDAFWAGETTAKITNGRRKYVIRFATMVQSNEESGNKRPVMLSLREPRPPKKKEEIKFFSEPKTTERGEDMDLEQDLPSPLPPGSKPDPEDGDETAAAGDYVCAGLPQESCVRLLRACVQMIGLPVEPDALNAIMRLCLRLTREFDLAAQFAELGGIRLLLGLKQSSSFTGFTSLASLLVRHVLEDQATLRHTIEKVVRSATLGNNAATTRELHYILRFLAPAAARNPAIFTEVGREILRVDLGLLNKRGEIEDDLRLLMKSVSSKTGSTAPPLQEISKTVIYDLLDFLVVSSPEASSSEPAQDKTQEKSEEELPASVVSILSAPGTPAAQAAAGTGTDTFPGSARFNNARQSDAGVATNKDEKTKEEKVRSLKPLLPKSGICRLLAEMVKSYAGCARLVTEHHYSAGISELVKEDCTAMAFILDELLTDTKDKDCSNLVRMLVAAIASCNHAPEAQTSLVSEVKNALSRALALPECANKHTKIQALTGLISTMIDSCPPSAGTNLTPFKQPGVNMNNIVKCMLKKGVITDLARVPHALDLSSPGMAASVNAAMKPLETLSKLVNQPTAFTMPKSTKSKPETEETTARNVNTNTTNSEATRAQGEEVGGNEAEATEHDLSTTASADPNSESGQLNTVEESFPEEFDSMMDQLLDRDSGGEPNILAEVSIVQSERRMDDNDDIVEQEQSQEQGEEQDTEAHSEVISDSDSDTDGSGEEDEEDGEELEDGEDGDEGEEDDDDTSGFLEDVEDDFQDMEDAAFFRMPGNMDREFDSIMMVGVNDQYGLGGADDRMHLQPSLFDGVTSADGVTGGADGVTGGTGSHVTPSHPLLMGRSAGDAQSLLGRAQNRTLQRSRGYRYVQLNPRNGGLTNPGTPAILQSLLGTDTSRHLPSFILNSQTRNNLHDARVVLLEPTGAGGAMDFDTTITILDGLDDELTGGVDGGLLGGGAAGSSLTTIPNALVRWTDESRVLDGESVHDCVTAIKPQLLEVIHKHREEEFAERREKKRKQQEEEEKQAAKKREEEQKKRAANAAAGGEPEAATTPAPESAGEGQLADGDEMDVVVSENSAVASLTATSGSDDGAGSTRSSLTDTVSRLSEDLVNAISSRMSTGLPARGSDLLAGVGGVHGASGTLSDAVGSISTAADASSLNTVLQTLTSTFGGTGQPPPPPNETSTPLDGGVNPPSFQFAAPSSAFPNIPIRFNLLPDVSRLDGQQDGTSNLQPAVTTSSSSPGVIVPPPSSVISSSLAVSAGERTAAVGGDNLPDALAPLSPSPDEQLMAAYSQDVDMTNTPQQQQPGFSDLEAGGSAGSDPSVPVDLSSTGAVDNSTSVIRTSASQQELPQDLSQSNTAGGDEPKTDDQQQDGGDTAAPAAGTSGTSDSAPPPVDDYSSILGDIDIPEGVDPSFLAALPEDMRQEVIEEQRRLLRARQAPPAPPPPTEGVGEVNPEFLAALPPNIQEEVLAQQRLEQQRQSAAQSDPSAPVDPSEFLQTLPPSLRQSLLAEMEDSQISALPAEIAAEAQTLRRDFEQRNRALMHERFFNHVNHPTSTLSSILRNTVNRIGGYTVHSNSGGGSGAGRSVWSRTIGGGRGGPGHQHNAALLAAQTNAKFKGRQLLDHEGLSCLLILLFIDDSKLNTTRLHKILRNLCYHAPTRDWVIKCLLSILERANSCGPESGVAGSAADPMLTAATATPPPPKLRKSVSGSGKGASGEVVCRGPSQTSWLNISMDAALGFRANVFQVQRPVNPGGGKKNPVNTVISGTNIKVHPQAAPVVCKNTLELLISLARSFSIHFLPGAGVPPLTVTPSSSSDNTSSSTEQKRRLPEFWETLLKLDKECWSSRKGKSPVRSNSSASGLKNMSEGGDDNAQAVMSGNMSAFGQLLSMLASPVIKRSSMLTDKLLRLLSLISLGQPESSRSAAVVTAANAITMAATAAAPLAAEQPSTSSSAAADDSSKPGPSTAQPQQLVERTVSSDQIKLAVEVLTSKACSEEGLEDVTALLLNLSYVGTQTRESILFLLLEGARQLGQVVSDNVSTLLKELRDLKSSGALTALLNTNKDGQHTGQEEEDNKQKGVLADRFTKEAVVLTAPTKPKAGGELQLSSMSALTSKTSSQSFFLRVLKVIIQLREAALHAMQKSLKAKKDAQVLAAAKKAAALALRSSETETAAATSGSSSMEEGGGSAAGTTEAAATENTDSSAAEADNTEPTAAAAAAGGSSSDETPMEVDETSTRLTLDDDDEIPPLIDSKHFEEAEAKIEEEQCFLESLSEQLDLSQLWQTLSACLRELADTPDHHAVLVLQPTVEAFFLVHAAATTNTEKKKTNQKETRQEQLAHIQDTKKFLEFAETHRTVLNQILRQSTTHLADGPFSVLVDHTRVLDFDIKRRYFRTELERLNEGMRREDLAVHVRREAVFEESFRELHRRSAEEWKNRFYIVFEGEEGQDAGGLLREWYVIISREIFNPNYALFKSSPGDRVTYTINDFSHINSNHLDYFKFVGRVIAKAIYDNKLLECYFTRSFYKHILAKAVRHQDMESEDYSFYKGLDFLLEHDIADLGYDLTYSTEIQEFGVTEVRDLIPNGRNIQVTDENKKEYVRLVCQMKMTGAIRKQLAAFLEGFYDIIPRRLISIFNEQELELLLSGLPDINIDDLKANTEYHKYTATSLQIVWFWRALRGFDQTDRAKFLQFVTGSSKVPLQGFGALEGMNGAQKFQIHRDDRSTDRLPAAHTCFNQLDLPVYETYDKLRSNLLKAIHECSEGFGFA